MLSILIPARHEEFLKNTIEDIIANSEVDTEVIATFDGEWNEPPVPQHERVNIIYVPEAIGQRAATNIACKLAKGKYVMKLDAHCSFDKGFDRKMIDMFKVTGDNVTMLPEMRNLHVFDWECPKDGTRVYQDVVPTCSKCGNPMVKKMIWEWRHGIHSTSYCFDNEPKFTYFEEWKHRPQYIKDKEEKRLTETMSIQGSCFMLTRKKYWDLNICDEKLGNWGNQGIEVACKTWLSGGRVLVNHNTWYAHCFRTKPNFGFSWPHSGRDQARTKANVKDLFWSGKWEKQIHPVSWLVEKFMPVKGWTQEQLEELKKLDSVKKE